jgi:hypothetical protein
MKITYEVVDCKERHFRNVCLAITMAIILGAILLTVIVVVRAEEIDLSIIAKIESNNNPLAVSSAGAVGLYQFTPIAWKDCQNNFPSLRKYPFICAYKPEVAILFVKAYLTLIDRYLAHFGLKNTIENRLACYNQGIGLTRKGIISKETKNYILKYKRLARAK